MVCNPDGSDATLGDFECTIRAAGRDNHCTSRVFQTNYSFNASSSQTRILFATFFFIKINSDRLANELIKLRVTQSS
jgi:hypothetical protein